MKMFMLVATNRTGKTFYLGTYTKLRKAKKAVSHFQKVLRGDAKLSIDEIPVDKMESPRLMDLNHSSERV